jgi:hypothetical protein
MDCLIIEFVGVVCVCVCLCVFLCVCFCVFVCDFVCVFVCVKLGSLTQLAKGKRSLSHWELDADTPTSKPSQKA